MPTDEELDALAAQLEPGVRLVVGLLRENNRQLMEALESLREELKAQRVQNAELKRMLFGPRSEKMPSMESEVRRAIDAEELLGPEPSSEDETSADIEEDDAESDDDAETNRRKRGRKRSKKARDEAKAKRKRNLPVVRERVVVTADQLPEGYTLDDFRPVGDGTVVGRYEHVREHLVYIEYVLETLASKDGEHIVAAPSPLSVQEGGLYGPGVYARVVVAKTDDSIPLNRMSKIFAREGAPIARSTLCALFHRAANLLEPLYDRLVSIARGDPYMNADETRMPVQAKKKCRKAWVWTFITPKIIIYKFSPTREAKVAESMLAGTTGTLQVDGYSGYTKSCDVDGRTRVGCWGHTRRGFFKCHEEFPEAGYVLERIVRLYMVEYRAAEQGILGTDEHRAMRQALSKPLALEIKAWCDEHADHYPPEGPMSKAIGYALNQWDTLVVFLDDPKLRLDNNLSERALRIIALGRLNFLFVGHDEAGQNLAILQSLVATCKLSGVNPYDYLADVLIRVQTHPSSRIDELLPMNWTPPAPRSLEPQLAQ